MTDEADEADEPPAGSRREHLVGRHGDRWRPVGAYVLLVGLLSWLYGIGPSASLPFGRIAAIEGWVTCQRSGSCLALGHPVGARLSLNTTTVLFARVLDSLGVGVEVATNLLMVCCLAVGVGVTWLVVRSFGQSHLAGALAGALYYLSPVVLAHSGLSALYFGFAWLPAPIGLAILAIRHARGPVLRAFGLVAAELVSALLLIYFDPYPWTTAAAVIWCIGGVAGLAALVGREWRVAAVVVAVGVAAVVPGAIYQAREGGSDLTTQQSEDFYRAMSADLGTVVVPTRTSVFGSLLHVPTARWDRSEFYGDGSNLAVNYVGVLSLVAVVAAGVVLVRRRETRAVAAGLLIAGAACLVVGLGPSLKLLDRASHPIGVGGIRYRDYLMPADEATVRLPWADVFSWQPFSSMRAVYRWHVGLRYVVAVLGGVAVGQLAGRRRVLAALVGVILIAEAAPTALWHVRERAAQRHDELAAFHHDVDERYRDHLQRGETVLFLPAVNDFLVVYLAPHFGIRTYNLAFDKELERVRKLQPPAVVDAITGYGKDEVRAEQLCQLMDDDLVDVVVFLDTDLRTASYTWPPTPDPSLAAHAEKTGIFDAPSLQVEKTPGASFVRRRPGVPCTTA